MKIKELRQLFSFRDLRNAVLALFVVFGGLGLAAFTLYAHRTDNVRLAGIGATASLVFVLLILIFVVPPLAKSASAEASQMNLPFEFTSGGAVFLGILVIVAFSAWNTGNNLLFLILAFLTSALIVSFFVGNLALKKIDVKMRFPETIFAGETTPIIVSLHNRKRFFPAFSIVVEVRGKEREKSVLADEIEKVLPKRMAKRLSRPPLIRRTLDYFFYLPPRTAMENRAEHIFERRGRFIIKDFELSTRFPFAFFRHRRRLPAQEVEIFIFPQISPVKEDLENLPLEIGKFTVPKHGFGQDLLSLRDYQPSDDLRRVDWKATARTRRLIVREYAAEDEKRITVVFDPRIRQSRKEKIKSLRERIEEETGRSKKQSPISKRFEKGVITAASILSYFADEKAEIRLIIAGEKQNFGEGILHLQESYKKLSAVESNLVETVEKNSLNEMLEDLSAERTDSHIFLVTTMITKDLPDETAQKIKIIRFLTDFRKRNVINLIIFPIFVVKMPPFVFVDDKIFGFHHFSQTNRGWQVPFSCRLDNPARRVT